MEETIVIQKTNFINCLFFVVYGKKDKSINFNIW